MSLCPFEFMIHCNPAFLTTEAMSNSGTDIQVPLNGFAFSMLTLKKIEKIIVFEKKTNGAIL